MPYSRLWQRLNYGHIPGGHADSFATSVALYLRPELVKDAEGVKPEIQTVDWGDPNLDLTKYSTSGVVGDPTQASSEIGKRLWEAVVQEVAVIFKQLVDDFK